MKKHKGLAVIVSGLYAFLAIAIWLIDNLGERTIPIALSLLVFLFAGLVGFFITLKQLSRSKL